MEATDIQPWLFQVEPLEGESLSHFLGRFRRANELTPSRLGKAAGIGAAIARWEKFRFNPPPSRQALAKVVGVQTDRLVQMLPPKGVGMNLEPIRLCGACYAEEPCHRMEWQFKQTVGCSHHQLRLLSECPNCGARFKIPALWVDGHCQRCFMTFPEMAKYQKPVLQ
jgi:hypothetical protein